MITVHHLNNSRSQRVLWLLEELGVPYEVKRYQRDAATMLAPTELRDVHPLGKSPVVTADGATLAESGAIVEYLAERHAGGRLVPAARTPEHLRYRYWMHYAEGSAMPPLLLKLIFDSVETAPAPFFMRPIARPIARKVKAAFVTPQLETHFRYIEGELATTTWFAGEAFSAADVQMSFPLEAARQRAGLSEATHPRSLAWLRRIHERPAYQRALVQGGKYDLAAD